MESVLTTIGNVIAGMFTTIVKTVAHNGWVLAISIVTAVALKTYVNTEKLGRYLTGRSRVSIFLSVAVGAFTPFCACGTMAVIVGMLTTALPWGPIMAFLTSSPLMSPDGFLMLSGLISLRFAVALTLASLAIGVCSGFATQWIERHTGYMRRQARYLGDARNAACACKSDAQPACGCGAPSAVSAKTVCGCAPASLDTPVDTAGDIGVPVGGSAACCAAIPARDGGRLARLLIKARAGEFLKGLVDLGLKQILLFFCVFVGIGYLVNSLVPTYIVSALLGANNAGAVPLASLIGLPLYLTTESSIPLIRSMLQSGASEGAMLAFIITGSATSAWVIAGLTTFMKRKALALYVGFILLGGMAAGYLYDLVLRLL
jgi:uncharacterized membrane protein YraQ (UPF0718 family)